MRQDKYILRPDDPKTPVPVDLMTWAKWFEDDKLRRVAQDEIGDVRISTVFLGLNHNWGDGPPLLWETLIFGGDHDQEMWRYSTWDEAMAGHLAAVALVKAVGDA